jgi:hypothetical protein
MRPRIVASRLALAVAVGGLCLLLTDRANPAGAAEVAPAPRPLTADRFLMSEIKSRSEIMKNLEYLSDRIGPRLTGSANLEKANRWTAEKMKSYGLENVRLEPWEIPYGWERGRAEMKLLEPDTGRTLLIASRGWVPGTNGKITADVVVMRGPKTKAELQAFKGKLKGAVVLVSEPSKVAPITELNPMGKKDEKKGEKGEKKFGPRQSEAFFEELTKFLKEEGVACVVSDSAKPHGLLVTTGGWGKDRAAARDDFPRVFMAHEHYQMLYRLAARTDAVTRVELNIENKFVPGPLTVFNTIGEVRGSEKPDEIVIIGAHLDSWDLASGTTDNGTGTCVVLETARVISALAKAGQRPKRTIRFCLFTGEEQGLWGSRKYVEKYKEELPKHSVALVHDTGTGKVTGFGLEGRENVRTIMEQELAGLKDMDGWKGLTRGGIGGGTDHFPFHKAGVPGFACNQETDEYRLTHHTQSDTFDKVKEPNLIQGAQVLAVTAVRVANLPDLLPRWPIAPAPREKVPPK